MKIYVWKTSKFYTNLQANVKINSSTSPFLKVEIVLTPEGQTDKGVMSPSQYDPNKRPSTIKPLCTFLEELDVKHKTDVCRICAVKAKHK